jgi:predicted aspartyl protease
MKGFRLNFCLTLLVLTSSIVFSETRCPGNGSSQPLRFTTEDTIMVVPVKLNGTGPYDFMVDTGAQTTVMEPSLAAELQLKSGRSIRVADGSWSDETVLVRPAVIEVGRYSVRNALVAVENLGPLQSLYPGIKGILGATFFASFDLLIDRAHKVLCLDQKGQMEPKVRGERIPFIPLSGAEPDSAFPAPALIPVRLSNENSRRMTMMLDSGTNVPQLYESHCSDAIPSRVAEHRRLGAGTDNNTEFFKILPPQNVRIGSFLLPEIRFVARLNKRRAATAIGVDGLLPVSLFRRVFISYAGRFVVLNPR